MEDTVVLRCNRTLYKDAEDELVESWGFLSRPAHAFYLSAAYLVFLWVGPKIMKSRTPYKLNSTIMAYNAFQVLMNIYIMLCYFQLYGTDALQWWKNMCCPVSAAQNFRPLVTLELMHVLLLYYVNKIIDLLDTIFFVLRKKQSQITFLHVYHHVSMIFCSYLTCMVLREEVSLTLLTLNAFVHVVMYSYYFLAACGPAVQKYLWWKKYITVVQILQFLLALVIISMTALQSCQMDNRFFIMWMSNVFFFLILFINFYIKAYSTKKSKTK